MKITVLLSFLLIGSSAAFTQNPQWLRYPAISPDGKSVAFSHLGEIFIVPSSGGEARAITRHPGHDYMPVWSKDGKRIAFASDRYGNFDLFIIQANGGGLKRLTFHSSNELPAEISEDGMWVYFSSVIQDHVGNSQFPTGALPELYRVHTESLQLEQVLTTPALHARLIPGGAGALVYEDAKGKDMQLEKAVEVLMQEIK